MTILVITPPAPIVTPADVPGSHASDDAKVIAAIAAVTEEIDGPQGWLGRCLGPQTLELVAPTFTWLDRCGAFRLPCPPIIEIVSVKYLDVDGVQQTVEDTVYRQSEGIVVQALGKSWPVSGTFADAVRIRYQAGYNGTAVADGGTGDVPGRAKQAIVTLVQHRLALTADSSLLRSESVEGIGSRYYTTPGQMTAAVKRQAEDMLSGLRVYS